MFGDHGMTDAGEHGGASVEETDSGLFVYRKPYSSGSSGNSGCVNIDGSGDGHCSGSTTICSAAGNNECSYIGGYGSAVLPAMINQVHATL